MGLDAVIDALRCPHCGSGLAVEARVLGCGSGHRFDVAKEGYVSFLTGASRAGTADTPAMVDARVRVLGSGVFDPLLEAIEAIVAELARDGSGLVVDAGGGTGEYTAAALHAAPDSGALLIDISKHACKRAARHVPGAGVIAADLWGVLPLQDDCASIVLNVFAPRNAAEYSRILRSDGHLVVVTPGADHLAPLVDQLGLLSVDSRKVSRLAEQLVGRFVLCEERTVCAEMVLTRAQALDIALMGPSGAHLSAEELSQRLSDLPEPLTVSLSVRIGVYKPSAD